MVGDAEREARLYKKVSSIRLISHISFDNPKRLESGECRVLRGGSWGDLSHVYFRGGNRLGNDPRNRSSGRGFRVSRTP